MTKATGRKVLVTGITGFIGSHVAIQLLNKGYHVRGTMRNLDRQESIIHMLREHEADVDRIDFVKGELTLQEDWEKAMEGIDYVIHVASPLPLDQKKDADDLIIPAREGTLNVLHAAEKFKVKRIVLTSSIAAIGYGHKEKVRTYTEEDWTNLNARKGLTPYIRSKTIAETEAWKFTNQPEVDLELTVINPSYVFGPLLEKDYSDSAEIVRKLMIGEIPGLPKIYFPLVDVRDVAEMHVMAMESAEAAGNRYLCVNELSSYKEIAQVILQAYPEFKKKIRTLVLPDLFIRIYGLYDKDTETILVDLGKLRSYDSSKATRTFGWKPRSNKEAILSLAESMIRYGVV